MATLQHIDSPDRGVVLLDENNRITCANKRAAELFGVEMHALVGNELPASIPLRSGGEAVIEEVIESLTETGAVLHRYSTPIYSSRGVPAGRIEIYSDITRRRGLEREIIDRNAELATLNERLKEAQEQLVASERLRALGEMAAGIAHDINNVLGIILGNVQLARRRLEDSPEVTRNIDAIELAARDAAETVRKLRGIGRPLDKTTFHRVDLSQLAREMVDSTLPALAQSSPQTRFDYELSLDGTCETWADPAEIREALRNLLLNAVQAIDGDGKIVVSTLGEGDWVEVAVSDNGVGMDEETRERIFDPFFTTRGAQGTGLGMSMVSAIAVRHGGRVVVESSEGIGSTVRLRLPRGSD